MKKEINAQEFAKFQKDSTVFTVLFIVAIILPVPLVMLWIWYGLAASLVLWGVTIYYSIRVEKYKKKYDIQTYKEIVAFTEGKSLDEIEKARESGKRPYQKALAAIVSGLLAIVVAMIMFFVLRWIL